jgi:hypothetical protein
MGRFEVLCAPVLRKGANRTVPISATNFFPTTESKGTYLLPNETDSKYYSVVKHRHG